MISKLTAFQKMMKFEKFISGQHERWNRHPDHLSENLASLVLQEVWLPATHAILDPLWRKFE